MWGCQRNSQFSEFVADCEAFLCGHLAERAERMAQRVEVWKWTNLLAHGSEEDLIAESGAVHPDELVPGSGWHDASSYLATEVIDLAKRHGPLAQLQHDVLVPLELDLASREEVDWWGPGQLVCTVRNRLEAYGKKRALAEQRARALVPDQDRR